MAYNNNMDKIFTLIDFIIHLILKTKITHVKSFDMIVLMATMMLCGCHTTRTWKNLYSVWFQCTLYLLHQNITFYISAWNTINMSSKEITSFQNFALDHSIFVWTWDGWSRLVFYMHFPPIKLIGRINMCMISRLSGAIRESLYSWLSEEEVNSSKV